MIQARILEKSEEKKWADFIMKHPLATIHQTPEWGHFQAKLPSRGKSWIIVLESSNKILGGTLLIRHKLPKGYSWLYAPRGPLLDYDSKNVHEQMDALLEIIKKIAAEEKSIFLRIDPKHERSECSSQEKFCEAKHLFPNFHPIKHGFQPEHTLILDLDKSESQLMLEMKPKGRYNIRLASKKGVTIRTADFQNFKKFEKDLQDFYKILTETTTRDGFSGHDIKFYEEMLQNLKQNALLYLAEFEGKIIAGSINTNFKDTATYYFGASSNEYRNLMAPYLLHWQAIQDAKHNGYKHYDFFGIAPENSKNHPWAGVTEFKKKFGGTEVSYAPAQEFIFKSILYRFYKAYKKLRKLV